MARISGIIIERSYSGLPVYAKIDLRKYGTQLQPFFAEIGVDVSPYDPKFVAKIKSQEGLPGVKIDTADLWK